MGWIQSLLETYDNICVNNKNVPGSENLLPIAHTTQQAQVEIVIDGKGKFRRAEVIPKGSQTTVIPCTEESAGRTSGPISHPLCDKLKYVAGDYSDRVVGSKDTSIAHKNYIDELLQWSKSSSSHPKVVAILKYVSKGAVIEDLVQAKVMFVDKKFKLLTQWNGTKADIPEIFKSTVSGKQEDVFVRWRVEDGSLATGTWEDGSLKDAWIKYNSSKDAVTGTCIVTGKQTTLANQHPRKIRHAADNAKLISSNDNDGYTYRGRFIQSEEVLGIGYETTQKIHSALQWLINRQGFKNGDGQVIVSWVTNGKQTPDLFASLFEAQDEDEGEATDVGQAFAIRLNKAIAGYRSKISDSDSVVVIVLDSATPGRLAIPYYRSLKGSEFLDRVEEWHKKYAWPQNFGKDHKFVGPPAPRDIAEAAYGRRLDDKLKKATVERLLPCIIDGLTVPEDLVKSTSHRTTNRAGLERWEFEKYLGIACSLYKGFNYQRKYEMKLEERTSRDYLFGRLLAVAERMEGQVIWQETKPGQKPREPTASRLFQRFSDRPSSTWLTIERALKPYRAKINSNKFEKLFDEITNSFTGDDFINDRKLSPEFLLGYRCQREALWQKKESEKTEDGDVETDAA